MHTIHLTEQTQLTASHVATIGFFDGVHVGHRYLIGQLKAEARRRGLRTMVITFGRHPRSVVHDGWQPQLLTSAADRERLLWSEGIDQLVVLPFDERMAALTARQFMTHVLARQLGVCCLLMGYDNHFGHRQTVTAADGSTHRECFDDYQAYGRDIGIEMVLAQRLSEGDETVSSSHIRRLLTDGDVASAARCLGRPYEVSGTVVHGEHIGSGMGFPTANISPKEPQQLIPREGVYGTRVVTADGNRHVGMTNIGRRPTFDGHKLTIETNIIDFDSDIYSQQLTLQFICRLRDERQFPSAEALRSQMATDAVAVRQLISL